MAGKANTSADLIIMLEIFAKGAKHLFEPGFTNAMDASAIALARENSLPIIVFSLDEPGGFKGILAGRGTYTKVS